MEPIESRPARHRLQLSATQLAASALAAVTATVAASYLGVSGTVIGAAVASVVTVIGNAVYSHSLRRTGARVRTAVPATARWAALAPGVPDPEPARAPIQRATSLRVLAAACAAVFVVVLILVTAVEVVAGAPLSDVLRGRYGAGTTVFGSSGLRPANAVTSVPSTPTVTVTAKVVTTTPTVTVTAPAVTATATPATTPIASGTTAAPTPTAAPSSTAGPSGTATP